MSVIAHTGHWTISLMYIAPFAVVALWLLRDRMRGAPDETPPPDPGEER